MEQLFSLDQYEFYDQTATCVAAYRSDAMIQLSTVTAAAAAAAEPSWRHSMQQLL